VEFLLPGEAPWLAPALTTGLFFSEKKRDIFVQNCYFEEISSIIYMKIVPESCNEYVND
jgi:hypothetical protein